MDAVREFDVVMVAEPDGGYSVFVPDLPSVATQGETKAGVRSPREHSRSSSGSPESVLEER